MQQSDQRPWIDLYIDNELRNWEVYRFDYESPEYSIFINTATERLPETKNGFFGESIEARKYWMNHGNIDGLFFADIEQLLGMNLDKAYGTDHLRRLTKPYNNHPAGCLVLLTFKDVHKGYYTIGIEIPKERS